MAARAIIAGVLGNKRVEVSGQSPLVGPGRVQEQPLDRRLYLVAGFPVTTLAAAATGVDVEMTVRKLFRPEKLVIPRQIGPAVLVNDLRIGTDSQFVTTDPIPGATFSEDAPEVLLGLGTAAPNDVIVLNLDNLTAAALNFSATILGPAVV